MTTIIEFQRKAQIIDNITLGIIRDYDQNSITAGITMIKRSEVAKLNKRYKYLHFDGIDIRVTFLFVTKISTK